MPASVAAVAFIATLMLPTSAADAAVETCQGKTATIVGTRSVTGTPGDDVIVTFGDFTQVAAEAGDDTVCLRSADDEVDAGPGNDLVDATAMSESTYSRTDLGSGSDTYLGGAARDDVDSGAGPDHDTVTTGDNKDRVTVQSDTADVWTQNGRDTVLLESANPQGGSLLLGRAADELLVSQPAADVTLDLNDRSLVTGDGSYVLVGDEVASILSHRAQLVGDQHANVLNAYSCRAKVVGGAGDDRLQIQGRRDSPLYDHSPDGCDAVRARVFGGPGDDTLRNERGRSVLDGGAGFDKAYGSRTNVTVCHAEVRRRCDG